MGHWCFGMVDKIFAIKNLTIDELVRSDDADVFSVVRNGQYLGAFARVGNTYHFRDQHHNTWVCACNDIDTGAENIEDAVAFMSY